MAGDLFLSHAMKQVILHRGRATYLLYVPLVFAKCLSVPPLKNVADGIAALVLIH